MGDEKDWSESTKTGHTAPATQRPADRSARAYGKTMPAVPRPEQGLAETGDVVTSAQVQQVAATSNTSGAVTLTGERISEPLARELIARRMRQEGIELQEDYAFAEGNTIVTLDGYDRNRRIGYQVVTHADADVVTDFSSTVEQRLRELTAQGLVHILIIHDYSATDPETVVSRTEEFLKSLPAELLGSK